MKFWMGHLSSLGPMSVTSLENVRVKLRNFNNSSIYLHSDSIISKKISHYICMYVCVCVCVCVCIHIHCFSEPHPWHMEFPRLGVELELQLPAYATVTAAPDLSHNGHLHYSSQKCSILNPLSEARNRTCILMDIRRVCFY